MNLNGVACPKASSMLGFSFSWLTAWGASCFEPWCADSVGARERKGKEGKGRERKGKEGKGRGRKGKEGKGRERKERKGKNKMPPMNPNAHRYVNGDDVATHGFAVTQNTFLKEFI